MTVFLIFYNVKSIRRVKIILIGFINNSIPIFFDRQDFIILSVNKC